MKLTKLQRTWHMWFKVEFQKNCLFNIIIGYCLHMHIFLQCGQLFLLPKIVCTFILYWKFDLVEHVFPNTVILFTGAELLVDQLLFPAQDGQKSNPNVFVVGSTLQRLLNGAEDVGLFKEFQDGTMRGFTYVNRESFRDFNGEI